jgi:hypothetical protein
VAKIENSCPAAAAPRADYQGSGPSPTPQQPAPAAAERPARCPTAAAPPPRPRSKAKYSRANDLQSRGARRAPLAASPDDPADTRDSPLYTPHSGTPGDTEHGYERHRSVSRVTRPFSAKMPYPMGGTRWGVGHGLPAGVLRPGGDRVVRVHPHRTDTLRMEQPRRPSILARNVVPTEVPVRHSERRPSLQALGLVLLRVPFLRPPRSGN